MQKTSDCVVFGLNLHICDRTPVPKAQGSEWKKGGNNVRAEEQRGCSETVQLLEMSEKSNQETA